MQWKEKMPPHEGCSWKGVGQLPNYKRKKVQRKKRRKRKLRYLRRKLAETSDSGRRRQLILKIRRISPNAPVPEG